MGLDILLGIPLLTELIGLTVTALMLKIFGKHAGKWFVPSITDMISQEGFKTALSHQLDDYIAKFLEGAKAHPETIAAILQKPAELLLESFSKKLPATGGELEGDMLGTGLAAVGLPKKYGKYVGLLRLAQKFLGGSNQGEAAVGNGTPTNRWG